MIRFVSVQWNGCSSLKRIENIFSCTCHNRAFPGPLTIEGEIFVFSQTAFPMVVFIRGPNFSNRRKQSSSMSDKRFFKAASSRNEQSLNPDGQKTESIKSDPDDARPVAILDEEKVAISDFPHRDFMRNDRFDWGCA